MLRLLFFWCMLVFLDAAPHNAFDARPRARPALEVFGGLPFLEPQGRAWPGMEARARRLRKLTPGASNRTLPRWDVGKTAGEHSIDDGSSFQFAASARPHTKWSEILSADLEPGVGSVSCTSLGGQHTNLAIDGAPEVILRWFTSVQMAADLGHRVLIVGSGGWDCGGGNPWYISTAEIVARFSETSLLISGQHLKLHEAFEELDFSLKMTPAHVAMANISGRRTQGFFQRLDQLRKKVSSLLDKTFSDSISSSTSYGFNWDFDAGRPLKEVLSLVDVSTGGSSSAGDISGFAGLTAECIECFVRAVAGIDIRYSFSLLRGQPRLYAAVSGNAELHGWIELVATVRASSTWDRLLAKFMLPKIVFYIYGFPVALTPFTTLRSSLTVKGARVVGSVRGGVGVRGFVRGRVELNTDGWDALPADLKGKGYNGKRGLTSSLDLEIAQRVVPPTLALEVDELDAVLRLVPAVGIKFYDSFSAVMSAEGYLGAQITDRDAAFNFRRADNDMPGLFYARPEQILNLKYQTVQAWTALHVNLTILGEEETFTPAVANTMSAQLFTGSGDRRAYEFNTSDLDPNAHMSWSTYAGKQQVRKLNVQAAIYETINDPDAALTGSAQCLSSGCNEVSRPQGTMLSCTCQISLDSSTEVKVGTLVSSFFWVPDDNVFVPPLNTLFFTLPMLKSAGGGDPVIWSEGGRYELRFILDNALVDRQNQVVTLGATSPPGGAPVEIQPGQTEIRLAPTSGAWDFAYILLPNGVTGLLEITATWADQVGQIQVTRTSVLVKPQDQSDFYLKALDPKSTNILSAFEDLSITWKLRAGLDGHVHMRLLDESTKQVIHEKRDCDATLGQASIPWLNIRGSSALGRNITLSVQYSNNGYPISVLRLLEIRPPRRGGRLLRNGGALNDLQTNSQRKPRQLQGLPSFADIKKTLFQGCTPDKKYALFAGVDAKAAIHVDGACKEGAACPETELVGGTLPILKPTALNCTIGGINWCQGDIYTCSNPPAKPYQPVIALKLSHSIDTSLAEEQLKFFRQRISTALSVLPADVKLPDLDALEQAVPKLIFQLKRTAKTQLTQSLVQAAVDAGLLSLDDSVLISPMMNAFVSGTPRRMQSNVTRCSANARLGECDSLHGSVSGRRLEEHGGLSPEARRLRATTGLRIIGVEEHNPTIYAITHSGSSGVWSAGLVNWTVVWVWLLTCCIACEGCRRLLPRAKQAFVQRRAAAFPQRAPAEILGRGAGTYARFVPQDHMGSEPSTQTRTSTENPAMDATGSINDSASPAQQSRGVAGKHARFVPSGAPQSSAPKSQSSDVPKSQSSDVA